MIEESYPKVEPTWQGTLTVAVKSKEQAATLACALIRMERVMRKPFERVDFKDWNLAWQLPDGSFKRRRASWLLRLRSNRLCGGV